MNKAIVGAMTALCVIGSAISVTPAAAQDRYRDRDRDGYSRDDQQGSYRDRDRRDERRGDRRGDRRQYQRQQQNWRFYGGQYGYNGYQGNYRTGQRYPYYNNQRYVLNDYSTYGLPAPRRGYRYYRDNNGDVVMAAVASGIIGLIIGGALSGNSRYRR